ncbi:MAG: helix-turn-helix domain-containing protein, partial [Bacteroidota bacterium]
VNPSNHSFNWKYHYSFLFIAITVINILYPWDTSQEWYYFFYAIYYIWLGYILLSSWVVRSTLAKLFRKNSSMTNMEIWVVSIFIGNLIIWIAYNTTEYTSYIVGALSFSFVFYLLILLLIFTKKKDPGFMSRQVKYGNKKISEEEADLLLSQLKRLMRDKMLFKDSNLKLSDVAYQLKILPHTLSQLINDNLDKNFTLFINEYRIYFAKELIKQNTHLKLEAIGYDSGFNSKSAFYAAFKKITGMTPAQFKEKEAFSES